MITVLWPVRRSAAFPWKTLRKNGARQPVSCKDDSIISSKGLHPNVTHHIIPEYLIYLYKHKYLQGSCIHEVNMHTSGRLKHHNQQAFLGTNNKNNKVTNLETIKNARIFRIRLRLGSLCFWFALRIWTCSIPIANFAPTQYIYMWQLMS